MAGEALKPLTHTSIARLSGQVVPGANWLTFQIQESAVFIAGDWVVSIHGEKLIHCVSAMCVLINSINQLLQVSVSIGLLTPLNKNENPLHRLLERESKKARARSAIKWGFTIVASALAGALLQWLFGGGLQL